MDFEKVKEFIEANKDSDKQLKEYFQGFATEQELNTDEILGKFESDEKLKKWLESEKDKHFTKGLETFKQKTMPKILEDEIKKRTSGKDEKDLEMDNLRAEIEKIKRDKLRESLRNSAFKFANEHKLPADIIDYFISIKSDDEEGTKSHETTMSNLNQLKDIWSNSLQEVANEKLKSNGFNPKDKDAPKSLTREQLLSMSKDEVYKLQQENPELLNQALKGN